jgi:predicted nucleotidyltransferase
MAIKDNDLLLARKLKERIATIAPLVDFRVFGSRARGDATWDSDMDIFIEFETVTKTIEEQVSDAAWEIGFYNDCIVICPLVFSRYEVEESPMRISSLVKVILEEGVRV